MNSTAGNAAVKPFGISDKIGYVAGNLAGDFTFSLAGGFLLKFYTDVMGVDAYLVGIMMMVAQVLDAVTDIAMGQIVDRSREGKGGKFKPWIMRFAGPCCLTSFLMYAVWFKDMPMGFKVVWMFATYLLYCSVFYTGATIPYGSLASAISDDPVDRAHLSNCRHIGGTLAITFINVLMPMVVYYKDAEGHDVFSGTRMAACGAIFSIVAFLLYIVCVKGCTERVKIEPEEGGIKLGELVKDVFANRGLIGVALLILIQECSNSAFHGMSPYIFPNYFGNGAAQSVSGVLETVITLVIATFVISIVAKVGKKEITAFGALFAAASFGVGYVIHTHSVNVWLVIYSCVTVGLALFNPVAYALVTDIVDDTEVRTGRRIDGTIYGVYSFARKFGGAVSSGVRGVMLSLIGYTAATAFDPEVIDNIYNISCLIPMIGFILMALVVIFVYPLGKKQVAENVRILKERRAAAEAKKD